MAVQQAVKGVQGVAGAGRGFTIEVPDKGVYGDDFYNLILMRLAMVNL